MKKSALAQNQKFSCLKAGGFAKVKYLNQSYLLGDSLVVELPALDRAALVRFQVPQPS